MKSNWLIRTLSGDPLDWVVVRIEHNMVARLPANLQALRPASPPVLGGQSVLSVLRVDEYHLAAPAVHPEWSPT